MVRAQYKKNQEEQYRVDADELLSPPNAFGNGDGVGVDGQDPTIIDLSQDDTQQTVTDGQEWNDNPPQGDSNTSPMTDQQNDTEVDNSGESMGATLIDNGMGGAINPMHEMQPNLLVPGVPHSDSQSVASQQSATMSKGGGVGEGHDENRVMNGVDEPFFMHSQEQPDRWKGSTDPTPIEVNGADDDEEVTETPQPESNDGRSKFRLKPKSRFKSGTASFGSSFGDSIASSVQPSSSANLSPNVISQSPSDPTTSASVSPDRTRGTPISKYQPKRYLIPSRSYESDRSGGRSPSQFQSDDNQSVGGGPDDGMDDEKTAASTQPRNSGDGDECKYAVMDLLKHQKFHLQVKWSQFPDVPRSVRMFCQGVNNEKYMENVVAMFERKCANPWIPTATTGKAPTAKKDILFKKLTGTLNKMTPDKFDRIAKQSMDIVNEFAASESEMQSILALVLKFGIKQPAFCNQYAALCNHLHLHLHRLALVSEYEWIAD